MFKLKKVFSFILIISLLLPLAVSGAEVFPLQKGSAGDEVYRVQHRLRMLGFLSFRATGKFSDMTLSGVIAFQQNNGLDIDGIIGENFWNAVFSNDVSRRPANPGIKRTHGPGMTNPFTDYGDKIPWSIIKNEFKVGDVIDIYDLNTSVHIRVRRVGGTGHADVEPVGKQDLENFMTAFGNDFTWEKRAFVALIDGDYVAASLFGMPCAREVSEGAGISEALCLYFYGSSAEIGKLPDMEHNNNIERAANQE